MLTTRSLDELVGAAHERAEQIGVPMAIAIVDPHGYLARFDRASGAGWVTVELAQGKARASAAFGSSTVDLAERWAEAALFTTGLIAAHAGRMVPAPGGEPIFHRSELIGAIGASGGTGAQDADVVRYAVKKVMGE